MTSEPAWGRGKTRAQKYPLGKRWGWTDLGEGVFCKWDYPGRLRSGNKLALLVAHKHHSDEFDGPRWHVIVLPYDRTGQGDGYGVLSEKPLTLNKPVDVPPCLVGSVAQGRWVKKGA